MQTFEFKGRERSGMDTEIVGGIRSRQYRLGGHDTPDREVSSKRMIVNVEYRGCPANQVLCLRFTANIDARD